MNLTAFSNFFDASPHFDAGLGPQISFRMGIDFIARPGIDTHRVQLLTLHYTQYGVAGVLEMPVKAEICTIMFPIAIAYSDCGILNLYPKISSYS